MKRMAPRPAPVFPTTWRLGRTPDSYQPSLVERTVCHVKRMLEESDEDITLHLFKARKGDRQCERFNKELSNEFTTNPRVKFVFLDPTEWGFLPRGARK